MRTTATHHLTTSVIIPTYNRAEYVRLAIDSALEQSRVPDEIIVVDDGSIDDTMAALAGYGPPVRVIRQPNRGRSAARNRGLREAQGDLIVFLDSDDTLTPASIEARARMFEARADLGVVYGDMVVVDAAGRHRGNTREIMAGSRPTGFVLGELAVRCFILMPAMIRRSALGAHRFDESLAQSEDYDLWRRLAAECRFDYVPEPVACYRLHDTNTVVTEPLAMHQRQLEVQRLFFSMAEFAALSRRERARAYCYHGAKHAALGHAADARHYLARSVAAWPLSFTSVGLLTLALASPGLLSRVILRRRLASKSLTEAAVSGTVTPPETAACLGAGAA